MFQFEYMSIEILNIVEQDCLKKPKTFPNIYNNLPQTCKKYANLVASSTLSVQMAFKKKRLESLSLSPRESIVEYLKSIFIIVRCNL